MSRSAVSCSPGSRLQPARRPGAIGLCGGRCGDRSRCLHLKVAEHYNFRFGDRSAVSALERHHRYRPVHRFQELSHGEILRPLPPGSLCRVAADRACQLVPCALVHQEHQHAERRKGNRVYAPLRGMPQSHRAGFGRADERFAHRSPLRRTTASPARSATRSRKWIRAAPAVM